MYRTTAKGSNRDDTATPDNGQSHRPLAHMAYCLAPRPKSDDGGLASIPCQTQPRHTLSPRNGMLCFLVVKSFSFGVQCRLETDRGGLSQKVVHRGCCSRPWVSIYVEEPCAQRHSFSVGLHHSYATRIRPRHRNMMTSVCLERVNLLFELLTVHQSVCR